MEGLFSPSPRGGFLLLTSPRDITQYIIAAAISILVLLLTLCCVYIHTRSKSPFPGGKGGEGRDLFRRYREDAFLLQLRQYVPSLLDKETTSSSSTPFSSSSSLSSSSDSFITHKQHQSLYRTITMDTVTATAEPAVIKALLSSRPHSMGRSIVYRFIAYFMPSSDGILFAADGEWKKRHTLFTQLFASKHIHSYTAEIFAGAVKSAEAALATAASTSSSTGGSSSSSGNSNSSRIVKNDNTTTTTTTEEYTSYVSAAVELHSKQYENSEALLGSATTAVEKQIPLGGDEATRTDLLTFVRWCAMQTLLEWALGVSSTLTPPPTPTPSSRDDSKNNDEGMSQKSRKNNQLRSKNHVVARTAQQQQEEEDDSPSQIIITPNEARSIARTLDAYSRTCFEIMPVVERRPKNALIPWIREYLQLRKIASTLRTKIAPALHIARLRWPVLSTAANGSEKSGSSSSTSRDKDNVAAIATTASTTTNATTTTPVSSSPPKDKSLTPDNFLYRMITAGWDDATIISEINHLHGAHKAVALLTTCALFELSAHPSIRQQVIAELESVCHRPPPPPPSSFEKTKNRSGGDGTSNNNNSSLSAYADELIRHVRNLGEITCVANSSSHGNSNPVISTENSSTTAPSSSNNKSKESENKKNENDNNSWRLPMRSDIETNKLPFTIRVLRETARRHVVSMGTMRKLGEAFEIEIPSSSASSSSSSATSTTQKQVVVLPKNHEIMIFLHAVHHDPHSWGDDAHVWQPDRWDPTSEYWARKSEREKIPIPPPYCFPSRVPDAYIPFLSGTRRCAGMYVAELEFLVMLYAFLVVYDVQAVLPPVSSSIMNRTSSSATTAGASGMTEANTNTGLGGGTNLGSSSGGNSSSRVLLPPEPGVATAVLHDPMETKSTHPGIRYHLVKRADMFTSIDGIIPFTIARRA